jgi:EpsI family protein
VVIRAAAVILLLLTTRVYIADTLRNRPGEPVPRLAQIPLRVGVWAGQDTPIEQAVLDALGLDDHINRTYQRPAGPPVTLYVGYYGGTRTGNTATPHPPMVCLPGQGWQPIETGTVTIPVFDGANAPASLTVSRYVIDNALSRFLLLFWYQINDRAVPTELTSKLHLFADGLRARGTNTALVRIAVPLIGREAELMLDTEREAMSFVQAVRPSLARQFPGVGR